MKRLLLFCAVVFAAMFSACTEDESSPVGDVYGIVSDLKSGAPVRNAEVVISPSNASTVSGSDGHFEFKSLTPGQYKISVEADGYSSNSRQVTVVAGQRISCDIHLAPEADNDVISINPTSIDFGTNELQVAATVTNESDSETEWFLDLGDTPWLYAYPTTGRIGGGKTHSIVFTANRARMNEDKSSVVNISAFGNTHPLSLKCKQSVQLSSVMVVESLNVDFGEESTEQIIRIRNVSETDVNWTLYKVQSERLSMSSTYGIVAPGGSQIVTIRLDREGLDEVLATTFMISDGTVDQPVNVIAYPTPEGATTTNKIFYTSTDGNIVEPYDPSAFGANIVSNTYEYGQGIIVFDGDVTEIGQDAFRECVNLLSITIPSKVTKIGDYSLYNCSNLASIDVPDGVTEIGYFALYNCSKLESINLPETLVSIAVSAFESCSSLVSISIPSGIKGINQLCFGYCTSLESVHLPEGLTNFQASAFLQCSSLKSITLPNSLTSIGYNAFSQTGLTSINIPENVWIIGDFAFSNCESLASVTIPESVTNIGEYAFCGCSSLTSITIPESVTSIGYSIFADCHNLEEFKGKFASADGRLLISDGVLYAFAPAGLTSISIPDGVTSIGRHAFSQCRSLTSITIPDSVTTFDDEAFSHCSGLTSITIPKAMTSIGNRTFFWCESLTSVYCEPTTPPAMKYDESYATYSQFLWVNENCKIYVPDDSYDAYISAEGWVEYKDMIVNPNASAVQSQIFYTSTDGAIVTPYNTSAFLDADDNALSIVSNVYEDGQGVITIDGELSKIGKEAFYNCSNLASINIPDIVTSIGTSAFSGCSGLTSIDIPDGVTSIGTSAFSGCSGLTSINIPDGVTLIGPGAFARCRGLTSVNIPDTVTTIESSVFSGCSGLTSITIPDAVTSIGTTAFYYCSSLTSINIPDGVTSIGESAFSGCSSLTSINIPDGVTSIESGTFSVSGLTSITIPDAVTSIGEGAFNGCSSLTSITIPDGVTSIGARAFNCPNLASVYCKPTTPPTLGTDVFSSYATSRQIYVPTASVDAYQAAENWSSYADAIVGYDF